MNLGTSTARLLAGSLAALTISTTTLISPPAEAWNPFSWIDHTSGSMVNRVVHGVVGGLVFAGSVTAGILLTPVLGPWAWALGFGGAVVGLSMLGGAVQNHDVTAVWAHLFGAPYGPSKYGVFNGNGNGGSGGSGGSGSGGPNGPMPSAPAPGNNGGRNGSPGNGGSGAGASQSAAVGQNR